MEETSLFLCYIGRMVLTMMFESAFVCNFAAQALMMTDDD